MVARNALNAELTLRAWRNCLLAALAAALAACGQPSDPARQATTLAEKIAAVDAGSIKEAGSPEVGRARSALAAAAGACKLTEAETAVLVARARTVLSGEGKQLSLVDLLEALAPAAHRAPAASPGPCQALIAVYTAARRAGKTHDPASAAMEPGPVGG